MPYIIETKTDDPRQRLCGCGAHHNSCDMGGTRIAVATLDEARAKAGTIVNDLPNPLYGTPEMPGVRQFYDAIVTLPESGGTIGPLPDGTVIEVRPAEWSMLARSCEPPLPIDGPNGREWTRLEMQAIIAGFNA